MVLHDNTRFIYISFLFSDIVSISEYAVSCGMSIK
jgi:hypothetical protein